MLCVIKDTSHHAFTTQVKTVVKFIWERRYATNF